MIAESVVKRCLFRTASFLKSINSNVRGEATSVRIFTFSWGRGAGEAQESGGLVIQLLETVIEERSLERLL